MRRYFIMDPLLDEAGDGTGGGSQTGAGASGQQQTTATQNASQSGQQSGTQQSTQQTSSQQSGQSASPTEFRYKEDRTDWVPRHRLNETSQKVKTLEEQTQDLQRKLTIALGGHVTDPQTQKAEQIRDAFFALPGMAKLKRFVDMEDAQLEQLFSLPAHAARTQQAEQAQWQRHSNSVVDAVSQKIADAMGVDALEDDQRGDLRPALSAWMKSRVKAELQQAADRYGEEAVARDQMRFSPTLQKYESADPKLLDEFVTRYTKNWVEPARRSATARTSTRTRPVPDGSGRTAVTSVTRPEKFKDLDERLDFAVKVAKERGVQFGR
jgi:hypothetical protein